MSVKVHFGDKSGELRSKYLEAFIDTNCEYYKKHIERKSEFSDGLHHEGYLWECLRNPEKIYYSKFIDDICRVENVYVLADDLSRDRVFGPPLWPWPAYSVIELSANKLICLLDALPDDLYVFDRNMEWTRIITHENIEQIRNCFSTGSIN